MKKLHELYRQLARHDFRIFQFKIKEEDGTGIEFLMHHRNDLLNQIEAKKRNSQNWILNDVLERARKRQAYTQEAEDMIKKAHAQQRSKCENCQLYLDYPYDLPEDARLCGKLQLHKRLESEEVPEEELAAAKEMPKEEWCSRYEPIFPDEMVFLPFEKEVEEIQAWLQEELSRL